MDNVILREARKAYHRALVEKHVLSISAGGVASNADSSNAPSKEIAGMIVDKLGATVEIKIKGQTAGNLFEQITMQFVADTFPKF